MVKNSGLSHNTRFEMIAFDADDTLWHNETYYHNVQTQFKELLADYCSPAEIDKQLYQTEVRNLEHFGYGIKAFTLSMIETAIDLSDGRVRADEIQQILNLGKDMLQAEVQLLDGVAHTLEELHRAYSLMMITKGDLLDQQSKVRRSGLAQYFHHVEVVSHKTPETYREIIQRHDLDPAHFLMVGNSLKSDILPVLQLGSTAVYIPYQLTWAHETLADEETLPSGCYELESITQLPELITHLNGAGDADQA